MVDSKEADTLGGMTARRQFQPWYLGMRTPTHDDNSTYMGPARTKPAKKSHYHHGDLRRVLNDTALKVIAKDGVAAVSLRELALSAGVSPAAPYRHFRDKEALFSAIAGEGFRLLTQSMLAAREAVGKAAGARLAATGVAYVQFAVANPGYFKVMFSRFGKHDAPPDVSMEGANAFGVLVESIAAAQAVGQAPKMDRMRLALTAWSCVHGLATLAIDGCLEPAGFDRSIEDYARRLVGDLLSLPR
jgi:AcrR family transcriptional regulator